MMLGASVEWAGWLRVGRVRVWAGRGQVGRVGAGAGKPQVGTGWKCGVGQGEGVHGMKPSLKGMYIYGALGLSTFLRTGNAVLRTVCHVLPFPLCQLLLYALLTFSC